MIYLCRPGCGIVWALAPTGRKVRRAPARTCPDCKDTVKREPRSKTRRGKR